MSNKSPSIDETFKSLERLKEFHEDKKPPKKKKPKAKKPKPLVEAKGGGKVYKYAGGGKVKYRRIGGKVINGNDITKMIYG